MTDQSLNAPVVSVRDGAVVTNSRDVAAYFEKNHRHVLRDIDNLLKNIDYPNLGSGLFWETALPDAQGIGRRTFDMSRDGFTLLAMGFTGAKALSFKLRYIEQFNAMETALRDNAALATQADDIAMPAAAMAGAMQLTSRELNAYARVVAEARRCAGRPSGVYVWVQTPLPALPDRLPEFPVPEVPVPLIDGRACLARLLSAPVSRRNISLGELMRVARNDRATRNSLTQVGVSVDPVNWRGYVGIALKHPILQRVFTDSPWAQDWSLAIAALPGARHLNGLDGFGPGRAILIPWDQVKAAG